LDLIQRNLQQRNDSETAGVQFLPPVSYNTFSQSGEAYTHQLTAESSCNNFQISRRATLPPSPVQQAEGARCNLEVNQPNYGVPCGGNENREGAWNFVSPLMQRFPQSENINRNNNPNARNTNSHNYPLFPSPLLPLPASEHVDYRYGGNTWSDLICASNLRNHSRRTELNINQDDTKEEKYGRRDVENGNERSLFGIGVAAEPFLPGGHRRNPINVWSQQNHCRRGWHERRIGLSSQEKQRRKDLKEEGINLYGTHSPLHFSIKTNNINRVKQLLRTNDPNKYHEGTGETPLHLACRLGLLNIVKLLRRHPGIKTDLLTTGGPQAEKPAGCTPISLANGNPDILSFLRGFKPKGSLPVQENTCIRESELQSLVDALKAENEELRSDLKKLEPEAKKLDGNNRKLKNKLAKMEKQDVKVMGTELPREKPNDTRKLAEVLSNVRKLEQQLTESQERLWYEKENEAKCSICKDRPKKTVLFPCGHLFCFTCSEQLSECHKCQKPIERRLQTSE